MTKKMWAPVIPEVEVRHDCDDGGYSYFNCPKCGKKVEASGFVVGTCSCGKRYSLSLILEEEVTIADPLAHVPGAAFLDPPSQCPDTCE
jgi:hypothetical protein